MCAATVSLSLNNVLFFRFLPDGSKLQKLVRQNPSLKVGKENFHLLGAINHSGTIEGGHYISTVQIASSLVTFDDSKVRILRYIGPLTPLLLSQHIL